MRKHVVEEVENPGFMMTPMIDVTFQLLVFFMLVNDISQAQTEKLELPRALDISKVALTDQTILIININKDGIIKVGSEIYHTPRDGQDTTRLEQLFKSRLLSYPEIDPVTNQTTAKYPVLIRAAKDTSWENIQRLAQVASEYGSVTKVLYGATKDKE